MANRGRIRVAEGFGGRVKFLPLAWAGMPKTSFRKNSDLFQKLRYQLRVDYRRPMTYLLRGHLLCHGLVRVEIGKVVGIGLNKYCAYLAV